jgi:hypothetical protein
MNLLDWLYENSGPIIRWRIVSDFNVSISAKEKAHLFQQLISSQEVVRWLNNLGGPKGYSGFRDTDYPNAMGKLFEYGIRRGYKQFDNKMVVYAEGIRDTNPDFLQPEVPFLIATGFHDHPKVRKVFLNRIERLYGTTIKCRTFNFNLSDEEASLVPRPWRGKRIYKPEHCSPDVKYPLPSLYDLFAISHWPAKNALIKNKIERILAYIYDQRFQDFAGGYLWNRKLNRCYAAGRGYHAVLTPEHLIIFMELAAKSKVACKSKWFIKQLSKLESYKIENGKYSFPTDLLKEKQSSYIGQGGHMGLGENRRERKWKEIESTFRMLNIKRLIAE